MSFFELFIAFRYLRAKRKQMFVSVVTFFSVAGIVLGVSALIIVLSVMNGFEQELREKVIGVNSHLICMNYGATMGDYGKTMEHIETVDGIAAATPFIYGQAMLKSEEAISGVVIRGIALDTSSKVVNIGKMKVGKMELLETSSRKNSYFPANKMAMIGIVVGRELAKNLHLSLFDTLTVISPTGVNTPLGTMPRMKNFVVVGIFDSGFYEYDASIGYISLAEAQSFFGMGNTVTGIEIKVNDVYKAQEIGKNIERKLGYPFYTRNWMEMNKNLFAALKIEKIVMFIILSLIVLVAAFNIITSLIMVVMEKSRDIAVLKSIGADSKSIMKIFVYQGMIVGGIGAACGCLLGLLVALNLNPVARFLESAFGLRVFPSDVYYFSEIPSRAAYCDVATIIIGTIIICFFATIYPARRASKLDPVEALRYE